MSEESTEDLVAEIQCLTARLRNDSGITDEIAEPISPVFQRKLKKGYDSLHFQLEALQDELSSMKETLSKEQQDALAEQDELASEGGSSDGYDYSEVGNPTPLSRPARAHPKVKPLWELHDADVSSLHSSEVSEEAFQMALASERQRAERLEKKVTTQKLNREREREKFVHRHKQTLADLGKMKKQEESLSEKVSEQEGEIRVLRRQLRWFEKVNEAHPSEALTKQLKSIHSNLRVVDKASRAHSAVMARHSLPQFSNASRNGGAGAGGAIANAKMTAEMDMMQRQQQETERRNCELSKRELEARRLLKQKEEEILRLQFELERSTPRSQAARVNSSNSSFSGAQRPLSNATSESEGESVLSSISSVFDSLLCGTPRKRKPQPML